MEEIIVYSKGCPKCRVLMQELNAANIVYTVKTKDNEIEEVYNRACMKDIPILEILLDPETGEADYYGFNEAMKWVGERNGNG